SVPVLRDVVLIRHEQQWIGDFSHLLELLGADDLLAVSGLNDALHHRIPAENGIESAPGCHRRRHIGYADIGNLKITFAESLLLEEYQKYPVNAGSDLDADPLALQVDQRLHFAERGYAHHFTCESARGGTERDQMNALVNGGKEHDVGDLGELHRPGDDGLDCENAPDYRLDFDIESFLLEVALFRRDKGGDLIYTAGHAHGHFGLCRGKMRQDQQHAEGQRQNGQSLHVASSR